MSSLDVAMSLLFSVFMLFAVSALSAAFAKLEQAYGKPVFGVDGKELPPPPDKPLPDPLTEN